MGGSYSQADEVDPAAEQKVTAAEVGLMAEVEANRRPRFYNSSKHKSQDEIIKKLTGESERPVDVAAAQDIAYIQMPHFTLGENLEDNLEWTEHLNEYGVVVLKGVIPMCDVEKARSLYWDWLESLGSGLDRYDPSTWKNDAWPGIKGLGFTTGLGGGHSKASWFLRAHPRVTSAFAAIWGDNKLLTSFDTFITWRPWWLSEDFCQNGDGVSAQPASWEPRVERLHMDRNPFHRTGRVVVQGMIPLYPANRDVGGLQVVPDSYARSKAVEEGLKWRYPSHGDPPWEDWLQLRDGDPIMGTGQLVKADPGDMILWDSRVIHGGYVGRAEEAAVSKQSAELARLSFTVAQTPYSSMVRSNATSIIESRWEAFRQQVVTSLTPHEHVMKHTLSRTSDNPNIQMPLDRPQIEITDTIRDLIGNLSLLDEEE